jgi:endonuclease YncB( thermonuclease family)
MIARDFLSKRIMHTWVRLENNGNDKYGRLLADVYDAKGENMGNLMIKKRMAVAYDGGTKKVPESWSNYHKNRI